MVLEYPGNGTRVPGYALLSEIITFNFQEPTDHGGEHALTASRIPSRQDAVTLASGSMDHGTILKRIVPWYYRSYSKQDNTRRRLCMCRGLL